MLPRKSTFAALLALSACSLVAVAGAEEAPQQGLPLQQISLFSSGVGYFERHGAVDGDASVTLYFQRDGLNDVLKSLLMLDPSGQLRPATYSLPELLNRSQGNDLPLPSDQTLGAILRHFQGAEIAITTGTQTIQGRLLSVATKTITDDKGRMTMADIATILTDDGLRTIRLDNLLDGGKVLLLDSALNKKLLAQLQQNASDLARSVDDSYIPVTLHFSGKGKREVSAAYIQGTTVWKTSYRLAFNAVDKNKSTSVNPLLQGWAIVENTTNEDWNDVSLNLVAGTPVSFTMNMSAPLYVQRNDVPVPFAHSLTSQVYDENMEKADFALAEAAPAPSGGMGGGAMRGPAGSPEPPNAVLANRARRADAMREMLEQQTPEASGAARGALFEYAITQPISLKRGQASMIPIVSKAVEGEKVSIFDSKNRDLHAVNGLSLKNTTKMHLAGGPLTIYEDGTYAGDAQITDLAPGEERLISYSLDSDLVIAQKPLAVSSFLLGMTVKKGVLTLTRKERRTRAYEFHNKAERDKKVLVLSPIEEGYELVKPEKPASKTKNDYRFEVTVPALKNVDFETVSERTYSQTVALLNTNLDSLLVYSREQKISPALKAALQEIIKRRNAIDTLRAKREELENQAKTIDEDQKRIRNNMNSLPRESELYKSYMAKLTAQEAQIEKLQEQIKATHQSETAAQQSLSDYIQNLDIE